ncbi:MAG TPA: phosphotransferase [Amycolatopsis sp.]|uniref:phosphotransferase n=1 Tax=Amycolatopsis sp. TaxID=37632 RepID=UPI002B47743A|nr:phosphotransferase [Amycolatopsis sp.]HKS46826.1 phosphotransferase [Amycolatopsis sp.]
MTVDTFGDVPDAPAGRPGGQGQSVEAAVAAGEAVLAHRFGSAIALIEPELLPGSGPATVVRARIASSPFGLPRTLVIKHYPAPPVPGVADPFAQEAVSYQLFTALSAEDRMCPELLGHYGRERVLVVEDLGRAPTLQDKLCGEDARAAERALLSWARSLGRMHATTAGREADFDALLRRLGGPVKEKDVLAAACVRLPGLVEESLRVRMPGEVRRFGQRAFERAYSAAYRAFSPADLSPDNNLVTSGGVRFLDFERGRVRNALLDVVQLRVPFASCGDPMALPAGMSEAMVAAWRAEVRGIWPALSDDEVLTASLLDHQLVLLGHRTVENLAKGTATEVITRQGVTVRPADRPAALVSWWRDLGGYAARAGHEALAAYARDVAEALDQRFGPGLALPLYPAFH